MLGGLAAGFGSTWEWLQRGFGPSVWVLLIGLVASLSVATVVAIGVGALIVTLAYVRLTVRRSA